MKIFKRLLENLVRSLFLVVLQPVDCKPATPVKKEFLEISSRATFRNIRIVHERGVIECRNFSCCFYNVDSTTGAHPTILKVLAIICDGVSF